MISIPAAATALQDGLMAFNSYYTTNGKRLLVIIITITTIIIHQHLYYHQSHNPSLSVIMIMIMIMIMIIIITLPPPPSPPVHHHKHALPKSSTIISILTIIMQWHVLCYGAVEIVVFITIINHHHNNIHPL